MTPGTYANTLHTPHVRVHDHIVCQVVVIGVTRGGERGGR
jgi:hypothetical protein